MKRIFKNAWVAVGDEANWERGLEDGIWGLVPKLESQWKRIEPGDLVLFYCIAPVKGFVGAGIIRSKFKQDRPLWKEELEEKRVIWPYRFEFDVTHLIPLGDWRAVAVSNKHFNLANLAGLNPVKDLGKAFKVLEALQFTVIKPVEPKKEIAATIFEMGKIQRMFVEADCAIESHQIDVIWKRTIRSVPTFAFSIELGRGLNESIQTLKHAYDLWNSRPFLVTAEKSLTETKETASGLYHEFASSLRILTPTQIKELYDSKKRYFDLEEKYGLR